MTGSMAPDDAPAFARQVAGSILRVPPEDVEVLEVRPAGGGARWSVFLRAPSGTTPFGLLQVSFDAQGTVSHIVFSQAPSPGWPHR